MHIYFFFQIVLKENPFFKAFLVKKILMFITKFLIKLLSFTAKVNYQNVILSRNI